MRLIVLIDAAARHIHFIVHTAVIDKQLRESFMVLFKQRFADGRLCLAMAIFYKICLQGIAEKLYSACTYFSMVALIVTIIVNCFVA